MEAHTRSSRSWPAVLLLAAIAALALVLWRQSEPAGELFETGSDSAVGSVSPIAPSAPDARGARESSGSDRAAPNADQPIELGLVDAFHPDHQPDASGRRPALPPPARGGEVVVRLEARLESLNAVLVNSALVRRILDEVNEPLIRTGWESLEPEPVLARSWTEEDALVLAPQAWARWEGRATALGSAPDAPRVLFGRVSEEPGGWRVEPASAGNPLGSAESVPAADALAVERGTVFTLELREDALWQDGHPFDAGDVLFSWSVYANPHVDCGEIRSFYRKLVHAQRLGPHALRFFYERQYFRALDAVAALPLLPAHLYDLTDPDNPAAEPNASPERRAAWIRDNPHNQEWIGLGPYRVVSFDATGVVAERWNGYFDRAHGGWLDRIRWRVVSDDNAAFQAMLNGELDFQDRVKTEDYFGGATEQALFTDQHYKGWFYTGIYSYLAWNLHRPELADASVRRALAQAVDLEAWRQSYFRGLAVRVTGHQPFFGPANDRSLVPLAYDPEAARRDLAEAGWYDRDGDGRIDRGGRPFELELLIPSGNDPGRRFGLYYQESLERLGIGLRLTELDWGAFSDRRAKRAFDCLNRAWVVQQESDPEQTFHSRAGGPGTLGTSNDSGLQDAQVDALIERGQRELDPERRWAIWRELQARVYELQPYLFLVNSPRKFAMSRGIRGFQVFGIDPNYSIRRWYRPAGG